MSAALDTAPLPTTPPPNADTAADRRTAAATTLPRSLHVRLIAMVLGTVTTVLVLSQAIDSHLTERTIHEGRRERAALLLNAVDSLWDGATPQQLNERLGTLVAGDREVSAIDVVSFDAGRAALAASTRSPTQRAAALPDARQVAALRADAAPHPLLLHASADTWRLGLPLWRHGAVVGAVQVDVDSAEDARLVHRLRWFGAAELLASVALISLMLTRFLARNVSGPVRALVDGMRRVERGELTARVAPTTDGELRFVAERFNDMIARLEALTNDLGAQVRRATASLAERNAQLQASNDRLWEAQLELGRGERLAALGQMAGTLAHELGTPLNSVLGYVQLLQRDARDAGQRDKLAIVESQLRRMIDEIRSVLDRTRDLPLRRGPVAVGALVADATGLVAARLAGRNLTLAADVAPELPSVRGEAIGLRQALLNLLCNAIDATPPGGTITVGAHLVHPDGAARPELELSVADSGAGMSPDELRRAFEPFYTTKSPERGTGLGLVIVDHIVRAHGGHIVAESTPGRGTAMRMRLPVES
ncbi:MAG: ATP-binding protein [Deltaproteobacteria bacterium]|nr:ATP-binding protein [Deltaproteobacteria bacterium]